MGGLREEWDILVTAGYMLKNDDLLSMAGTASFVQIGVFVDIYPTPWIPEW